MLIEKSLRSVSIAVRYEKDCQIELYPKARAELMVKEGAVHSTFATGKNKEREEFMDYTLPLVGSSYGVFVESSDVFTYLQNRKTSKGKP